MIKVVAKNFPKLDKLNVIVDLADEMVHETRKESGNISYGLYRDINDPSIITMIEEWESREALDVHMNSDHFTRLVPEMGRYMIRQAEISIYEQIL